MLRCHLTFVSPEAAVSQFKRWKSQRTFSKGELNYLRDFLENILKTKGVEIDVPRVGDPSSYKNIRNEDAETVIEISSVRIKVDDESVQDQTVDCDITFQLGNTISFIINAYDKDLIDVFTPGIRLSDIQCFSPISLFNAGGIISEKKKITSGPKQGDYSVDLTIDSPQCQ